MHKSFKVNEYLVKAQRPLLKAKMHLALRGRFGVGLYTILQSPILYGVWHKKGGVGGGGGILSMAVQ